MLDTADQADARAAVDDLAGTARVRLRRGVRAQYPAFAAALPLGLVSARHGMRDAPVRRSKDAADQKCGLTDRLRHVPDQHHQMVVVVDGTLHDPDDSGHGDVNMGHSAQSDI